MNNDRPLPHNNKLEREVLSMLIGLEDNSRLKVYIGLVSTECFFSEQHRKLYCKIATLLENRVQVELSTVIDGLSEKLEKLAMDIAIESVTSLLIDERIKELKEITVSRLAILECEQAQSELYKISEPDIIVDKLAHTLKMLAHKAKKEIIAKTKDILKRTVDIVRNSIETGGDDIIVPYCVPAVDRHITHLRKQMHVLASFSGVGKTALSLSCMDKQVANGMKIAYFCGESSSEEIMLRLNSIDSKISFETLIRGMESVTSADWQKFQGSVTRLNSFVDNFYIFGKGSYEHSVDGIEQICRELVMRHGQLDMVYVDYLQNMKSYKHMQKKDAVPQIEANVMGISNLFGELNVAGVLLCQINREGAKSKFPRMRHLRGASTIENEAHIVSFLHRESDKEKADEPVLETLWYSDKTRVVKPFATKLAFVANNAEYTGLKSENHFGSVNNERD